MKIAILGTQNAGKSTLLDNFKNYKNVVLYPEKIAEISNLLNNSGLFNLKFNRETTDLSQTLFLTYFHNLMNKNFDNSKNYLFDRCGLDTMIYWNNKFFHNNTFQANKINDIVLNDRFLSFTIENKTTILEVVKKSLTFFDYYIFLESGAYELIDDNIRDININYIAKCNERFKNLFLFLYLYYVENNFNIKKLKYFTVKEIKENKHFEFVKNLI